MSMDSDERGTIFLTLVLDTMAFRVYHETHVFDENDNELTPTLDDAFHNALVSEFRSHFFDVEIGLEELGYKVVTEFRVDNLLSDEGYELRLSGDYDDDEDDVDKLRDSFVQNVDDFLTDLPELLSNLAEPND